MGDKDFLERSPQASAEPQLEVGETETDAFFDSGYRPGEEAIATDPPEEPDMDIDAILTEFREQAADEEKASDSGQQMPESEPQPPTEAALPESEPQPLEEHELPEGEDDEVKAMLIAMRELTEEVKQLRTQLEAKSGLGASPPGNPEAADGLASANALEEQPKKNKILSVIGSLLFYVVVVGMVFGAFLMRSTSEGQPFMIAGFSAANVLTSSMEDVYPRGSLIITRQVDAKELQIGDDITFMVSEDSSITHRIIGITENYQGTGARAFQTQGTKNPNPDKEMVAAANVVGKVIFHSKTLGDVANFVKENWPILIFVLIVIIALISFLKWNAKKSDEEDGKTKDKPKEKKPRSHTKNQNKHSERRSESNGDE